MGCIHSKSSITPEEQKTRGNIQNITSNPSFDINTAPTDSNTDMNSFQDLRDVVSFQTFLTQSEKPQIFEYEFIKSIGRGAQAEVYLVKNVQTNTLLAAKIYDKAFLYRNNLGDSEPPIQKTVREIQIMSSIQHPNCMPLVEVLDDDYTNSIIIIQPYADKGCLIPQQSHVEPFSEEDARRIFYQIALAVQQIHHHNIVHRDIKPENIMCFSDGHVCLADFSASIYLDRPDSTLEDTDGTPAFYSPEQCTGKPYQGKPPDIWACGVTLYMLIFGHLPFFDVSDEGFFLSQFFRITNQIQNDPVTFDDDVKASEDVKDLISKCLEKNPQTRLTIDEVLNHQWLKPCATDEFLIRIEAGFDLK